MRLDKDDALHISSYICSHTRRDSPMTKYSCNVTKLVFFSIVADRTCAVSRINSAARPEDQSRLNQADVEHGLRRLVHRGLFQRNGQCTLKLSYLVHVRSPYKFMQYVRRIAVKFNFELPREEFSLPCLPVFEQLIKDPV